VLGSYAIIPARITWFAQHCQEDMSGIDCDTVMAMDPEYHDYPRMGFGRDNLAAIDRLIRSNLEHPPLVVGRVSGGLPSDGVMAQALPPTIIFARPPVGIDPILRPLPEGVGRVLGPRPSPEPAPVPEILRPAESPRPLTPEEALKKFGPQPGEYQPGIEAPERVIPRTPHIPRPGGSPQTTPKTRFQKGMDIARGILDILRVVGGAPSTPPVTPSPVTADECYRTGACV
jgi:hypothetical protein